MAIFEIQGPDGKTYEVDAPSIEQAAAAMQSFQFPQGGSSTDSAAVGEFRDKGRALATGVANGASFGFGDNIAGVMGGLQGLAGGYGFKRGYDDTVGMAREGMARDAAANPKLTTAGNLMGAAIPALAAAPAATGGSMLGTAARGAGLGAFEGGLQGAGNADGQGVAGQALRGALIGIGVGAAAPAVVGAAGAMKNAVKDPVTGVIDGMFGIANKGKANRAISGAMKSSGNTADDITAMLARAAQQGQPEYRVMDALGTAGQRQASGIARQGGEAATDIANFLEQRQLGQGDRVSGFIDDAFGTTGTTAAKTRAGLTQARGDAANVAYDAARGNAAPVDVRGALGVIDDRIGGMQGAGIAGDSIDGKLSAYRARLAGSGKGLGPGVTSAELSDFDRVLGVKQSIQDDIGAAVRAGRNNEARELGKLASELDAALEGSSDMYRTANDGFREASKVIGAVDDGATMATRGRAADNVPAFQGMNPDMQGAARIGYGDNLQNALEKVTAPTTNRAKALQSPKRTMESDAMAIDPTLYRDRLSRENDMWATQNRALGGSRTADNRADQAAIEGLAGGVIGAARNSHGLVDMAVKMADVLSPLAKGQNEATRKLIAKALMSSDPVAALAPVLRQEASSTAKRRMIEALIRQPMREIGEGLGR
jgi:hypothetical protein